MSPALQEGIRIGPYRVVKVYPHHRGGFASVAIGVREGDNQEVLVALKITRSEAGADNDTYARALSNEVETLRRLKHPGIVRIYPIKVDNRRFSFMARATTLPGHPWYFVMEYLAGGSAEDLIDQYGAVDPVLAAEIMQQVGMALDYMHARGYAHLDVKPNNIMFRRPITPDEPPEAVLVDFGSAQKETRRAEVEAGALVYLPPERVRVMRGDAPPESVTNKSAADIYAMGVTFYRLLTGQLPFSGRRSQVTTAILHDSPTRPLMHNPAIRRYRELDELVMRMLDKEPSRRPTAQEVVTRLDQIVPPPRFGSAQIRKTLTETPSSRPSKGHTWRWMALLLGLALLAETAVLAINWPLAPFASNPPATPPPAVITTPTFVPITPRPTTPSEATPTPGEVSSTPTPSIKNSIEGATSTP